MKFRPLHDRVVVQRVKEDTKSAGGIIIPDTATEKPSEGKIVAVGPGTRNDDGTIISWTLKKATESYLENGAALKSRLTAKTC